MDSVFAKLLRESKNYIMKKGLGTHYNSTGLYYYLGNKGASKKIGNETDGEHSITCN